MSVSPITADIVPQLDVEREMLDYCAIRLRDYTAKHGPPMSIAFVLVGHDNIGATTEAYSWAPKDESTTRLHTCSVAATVLTKRALGLD